MKRGQSVYAAYKGYIHRGPALSSAPISRSLPDVHLQARAEVLSKTEYAECGDGEEEDDNHCRVHPRVSVHAVGDDIQLGGLSSTRVEVDLAEGPRASTAAVVVDGEWPGVVATAAPAPLAALADADVGRRHGRQKGGGRQQKQKRAAHKEEGEDGLRRARRGHRWRERSRR